MSTALAKAPDVTAVEKVILNGDLKELRPEERLSYYHRVCESLGLNPLTQPFAYMSLNGKMILYARKEAAEQLRSVREISLQVTSRENIDGVYVVTVLASMPGGRTDSSTGAVSIESLKGEAKANAFMKAETKAKRRVTLSICGLGLMDETEVETITGARTVSVDDAHSDKLIAAPEKRKVPEELMIVVNKLRKGDGSDVKRAMTFLQEECISLGIESAFTNRAAGLRASFPKGTVIPHDVTEGFMLDVWDAIEEARLAKIAADVPVVAEGLESLDKSDWLPEGLGETEGAK